MKVISVFILLLFVGCANSPNKSQPDDIYSADCSSTAMQELQNKLNSAIQVLGVAGKASDLDPTDENNAKTASAAADVTMYYSMLDIARSDCSTK